MNRTVSTLRTLLEEYWCVDHTYIGKFKLSNYNEWTKLPHKSKTLRLYRDHDKSRMVTYLRVATGEHGVYKDKSTWKLTLVHIKHYLIQKNPPSL